MTLDIRGSGRSYAIYQGDQQVSATHTNFQSAATQLHNMEIKARHTQRSCMCCQATFTSEGIHNRMCFDCRKLTAGMA